MASTPTKTIQSACRTIKTRILIISDTHCATLSSTPDSGFKKPLPPVDLLIHCGDLTYTGRPEEYHGSLDVLKEIDAPVKLVIAGNHDKTLDRDFLLGHLRQYGPEPEQAEQLHAEMRRLWTAADGRARREGVTFLDEGTHEFVLKNGARVRVYATPYTPEFCDWGFPYEHDEDRYNPPSTSLTDAKNIAGHPVPSFAHPDGPVDVMITHGPPFGRLDQTSRGANVGCPHLLRALMRARPLLHCFGHIHEARGAERVSWSRQTEGVATASTSVEAWKELGWKAGVEAVRPMAQGWGFDDLQQGNAESLAVGREGGKALARGEETLLVNASIMNLRYRPKNAPWLVEVDLPAASPA